METHSADFIKELKKNRWAEESILKEFSTEFFSKKSAMVPEMRECEKIHRSILDDYHQESS